MRTCYPFLDVVWENERNGQRDYIFDHPCQPNLG